MRRLLAKAAVTNAAVLVLASSTVSTSALAQDKPSWVYGYGTESCMEYSRRTSEPEGRMMELNWVLGYLSAVGQFVPLKETDRPAIERGVVGYCKNHPTDTLRHAAQAVGMFLMKQAAASDSSEDSSDTPPPKQGTVRAPKAKGY